MKMMIVGRRRAGMTLRELHAYMADVHGAMVVRYIEAQPGLAPQRYAQNHAFDGTCRVSRVEGSRPETPAPADPFTLNRDFVTQVWFDNPAHAAASLETPFYREQLMPDEDRFVEQGSVVKIPVMERKVPTCSARSAEHRVKLFVFYQRAAAVSHAEFMAAHVHFVETVCAAGSIEAARWVSNESVQRPGLVAQVDAVDELWLTSEAAARSAGSHLMAAAAAQLAGRIEPGSTCLLLAHEQVMFAGRA